MSCTGGGLTEGGVFKDATIVGGNVSNAALTACSLRSCTIESLASIDDASVKCILEQLSSSAPNMKSFVQALIDQPDEVLRPLQQRLQALSAADDSVSMSAHPPLKEEATFLPTTVVGEPLEVLGRPQGWLAMGDGLVSPLYRTECP